MFICHKFFVFKVSFVSFPKGLFVAQKRHNFTLAATVAVSEDDSSSAIFAAVSTISGARLASAEAVAFLATSYSNLYLAISTHILAVNLLSKTKYPFKL